MIHIILSILKVLGIIILAILGILLLLLLLILFVPICYDIRASKHENINARVKIFWILPWISLGLIYEKKIMLKVKLLLWTIYSMGYDDEAPKKKKEKKEKKEKKSTEKSEKASSEASAESSKISAEEEARRKHEEERLALKEKYKYAVSANKIDDSEREESKKEKKTLKERIADLKAKIKEIKNKIISIKDKLTDTSKTVHEKITYVCDMIKDEHNKKAIALLWKNIKKLFVHIMPKKHKIDIVYGNASNPATTADVTGYAAVTRSVTGLNIKLTPVFDEDIIEGDVVLKGRIFLIFVLVIAVKILLDKDFRKMLDNFT